MKHVLPFLITLFVVQCCSSQDCADIYDLIPSGKKFYMIGETHIDRAPPIYKEGPWMDTIRVAAAQAEDKFRNTIVNTCRVKTFLLESPLSFEYFYNKYLETGDEGWIEYVAYYPYERSKLRSIYSLKKVDSKINIQCVDVDSKDYAKVAAKALFYLTFYETNPLLFVDDSVRYHPEIDPKSVFPDDLSFPFDMWEMPEFKEIDFLAKDIYEAYQNTFVNRDKRLYEIFLRIKNESLRQNSIMQFYGDNYPYLLKLTDSYIECYSLKYKRKLTNDFFKLREEIVYKNIMHVYEADTTAPICLQIGLGHIVPQEYFQNINQMLSVEFSEEIFSYIMIADYYTCYNCIGLEDMNFDFEGHLCHRKYSEDQIYYLVK